MRKATIELFWEGPDKPVREKIEEAIDALFFDLSMTRCPPSSCPTAGRSAASDAGFLAAATREVLALRLALAP